MSRLAFVFPGQGSQVPGMGSDLLERHPELARPYFDTADEVLDIPLSRICFEGSTEELRDTSVTQPAVYLVSLVAAAVLRAKGLRPAVVAGHSLGEYTALACAGTLDWVDGLKLVRRRGLLMAEVNRRTPGSMAAVVGLPADRVRELCEEVSGAGQEVVEVANFNSAQQTVVSGTAGGVAGVSHRAREEGASHVTELRVGAPFHCSLMSEVAAEFGEHLAATRFTTPAVPVVSNVTASYVHSGQEARALLAEQLAAPVRWHETLGLLGRDEVSAFVEAGPGRVLTNLSRSVHPAVPALPAGTARQIDKAEEKLSAVPV
ncbi:ACP S-malonyltransferase [Streptomyces cyanogenus]|uniref:Malonyl CoA-acyl carrier protein transacylase n=1 Tax=Streptomyces cyanogenus TaxID=80860 RepID=A0ABX7TW69_STRCY|nr:ACP S-malonyltransferase [Streptomyces cyanogenus]QTD99691.1 Malonyl CoA-acyl carrier protein transacylase [Streptomyces cyanogenus]